MDNRRGMRVVTWAGRTEEGWTGGRESGWVGEWVFAGGLVVVKIRLVICQ